MSDEEPLDPMPEIEPDSDTEPQKNRGGRPKGAKRAGNKLTHQETAKLLTLTAQNVPNAQIARELGLSESGVSKIQATFGGVFKEIANVEYYREVKSQLLDSVEILLLKSLVDPEKHSKATLAQCAFAYDKLYQANRLERGLSTANVSQKVSFTSVDLSPLSRKGTK